MKSMLFLLSAAVLSVPLFAGDLGGWGCDNHCPLATQANQQRSFGLESRTTSKVARADLAMSVERNLARV